MGSAQREARNERFIMFYFLGFIAVVFTAWALEKNLKALEKELSDTATAYEAVLDECERLNLELKSKLEN